MYPMRLDQGQEGIVRFFHRLRVIVNRRILRRWLKDARLTPVRRRSEDPGFCFMRGNDLRDILLLALFPVAWIVLQKYILPRLGVPT